MAKQLAEAHVSRVSVSVDMNEATHDEIRGRKSSEKSNRGQSMFKMLVWTLI